MDEQIRKCVDDIWLKYDADNSGELDMVEAELFVRATINQLSDNSEFTQEDFKIVFNSFDKDRSGSVDKKEMVKFIKKVAGINDQLSPVSSDLAEELTSSRRSDHRGLLDQKSDFSRDPDNIDSRSSFGVFKRKTKPRTKKLPLLKHARTSTKVVELSPRELTKVVNTFYEHKSLQLTRENQIKKNLVKKLLPSLFGDSKPSLGQQAEENEKKLAALPTDLRESVERARRKLNSLSLSTLTPLPLPGVSKSRIILLPEVSKSTIQTNSSFVLK